jgi:peptidyl-prolyl cis-trans isomerase D
MMKIMRKLTKHILWIVIVAFVGTIVFAWGMQFTSKKSKTGIIATINGQDIHFQTFQQTYEQNLEQARKQYEEVTDEMAQKIRENTWEDMIYQTLLLQEVKKRNIQVTGKELYDFLRRFPPPEIKQSEAFQVDGKFDSLKYIQALADPRIPWGQLETAIRPQLQITKLQEQIISLIRITDEDVRKEYVDSQQKVKAKFILVPLSEFPPQDIEVTEKELADYYQAHKDKFNFDQRVQLDYVMFPKKASSSDDEKAKVQLLDLKEMLAEGDDFAALAKEYSQDPGTASKGGDLGWFGKGEMVKSFADAAFSLNIGETSDPVKTPYGWHLIKVYDRKEEKKEPKVLASHILIKVTPSDETIELTKAQAENFVDEVKKKDFAKTAAADSLKVESTPLLDRENFGSSFIPNEEAKNFAFEGKINKISDPFETSKGFYVLQIKQKLPAGIQPLTEAKEKVKTEVVQQKRENLTFEKAQKIYNEIRLGESFEKAVEKYGGKINETPELNRNSTQSSAELVGASFALSEQNPVSTPVKTGNGTYILKLVYKTPIDEQKFQAIKDSLTMEFSRKKQQEVYVAWFTELKKNSKISDYRSQYYREGLF